MATGIFPLEYQSGQVSLPGWTTLITLCFPPLIAHIVAGAPQPSYPRRREPRWHDRLCNYNPISIMWRYFAITDKRIWARGWTTADVAAANAFFWAMQDEAVAERSRSFCTRLLHRSRTDVLSWNMIKTVIVGLQAAQAAYDFSASLYGTSNSIYQIAYNNVFLPIGFPGFYRLCAAFWLTDEFVFGDRPEPGATGHMLLLPVKQTSGQSL